MVNAEKNIAQATSYQYGLRGSEHQELVRRLDPDAGGVEVDAVGGADVTPAIGLPWARRCDQEEQEQEVTGHDDALTDAKRDDCSVITCSSYLASDEECQEYCALLL